MMPSNKRNVRIKDIAKMAGVSEGTVDRVIHDRGNVSPKIEKRVRKILNETGYTPNPIARSLGATKDFQIAVMIPDPQQDSYWQLACKGIQRARDEWNSYNLHLTLFPFNLYNPDSFSDVAGHVLESKPDAVCVVPMFFEESLVFFKSLSDFNIPYVVFNTQMNKQLNKYHPFCFISPNLYQSGRVAADLMAATLPDDAQKLAVMHIHENIDSSVHLKQKERGFKDYFEELKTELDILSHSFLRTDQSFVSQISQIIAESAYDGIFVSTSSATAIAAQAIEEHRRSPIVLIGFDMLKENIRYLQSGVINFLLHQNHNIKLFWEFVTWSTICCSMKKFREPAKCRLRL